jgi:hypothetical protein
MEHSIQNGGLDEDAALARALALSAGGAPVALRLNSRPTAAPNAGLDEDAALQQALALSAAASAPQTQKKNTISIGLSSEERAKRAEDLKRKRQEDKRLKEKTRLACDEDKNMHKYLTGRDVKQGQAATGGSSTVAPKDTKLQQATMPKVGVAQDEIKARQKAIQKQKDEDRRDRDRIQRQWQEDQAARKGRKQPKTNHKPERDLGERLVRSHGTARLQIRCPDWNRTVKLSVPSTSSVRELRALLQVELTRPQTVQREELDDYKRASAAGGRLGTGVVEQETEQMRLVREGRERFEEQTKQMLERSRAINQNVSKEESATAFESAVLHTTRPHKSYGETMYDKTLAECGFCPSASLLLEIPSRDVEMETAPEIAQSSPLRSKSPSVGIDRLNITSSEPQNVMAAAPSEEDRRQRALRAEAAARRFRTPPAEKQQKEVKAPAHEPVPAPAPTPAPKRELNSVEARLRRERADAASKRFANPPSSNVTPVVAPAPAPQKDIAPPPLKRSDSAQARADVRARAAEKHMQQCEKRDADDAATTTMPDTEIATSSDTSSVTTTLTATSHSMTTLRVRLPDGSVLRQQYVPAPLFYYHHL